MQHAGSLCDSVDGPRTTHSGWWQQGWVVTVRGGHAPARWVGCALSRKGAWGARAWCPAAPASALSTCRLHEGCRTSCSRPVRCSCSRSSSARPRSPAARRLARPGVFMPGGPATAARWPWRPNNSRSSQRALAGARTSVGVGVAAAVNRRGIDAILLSGEPLSAASCAKRIPARAARF